MSQQLEKNYFSSMIGELKTSFENGKRRSIYYNLKKEIDNGDISDRTVLPFIEKLKEDISLFKQDKPISECAFFAPRRGQKNKDKLDQYIEILYPLNDKVKSIISYQKSLSLLSQAFKNQEIEEYKRKKEYKTDHWMIHDESSIDLMIKRPYSNEILEPKAMPIENTPEEDLQPIISYLKGNNLPENDYIQMNYCAVYNDGRFDSCKQGTGMSINILTSLLKSNDKIKHFLYGNNVMGTQGCEAICDLLLDPNSLSKIETWYIAGNDINSEGIKYIVDGLVNDVNCKELWLKRNPIKSEGAVHLKRLLSENKSIEILDLHNTALFDKGLKEIVEGLYLNTTLRTLYLEANGITSVGVKYLVDYFKYLVENGKKGITSIWLGINRISDEGTIELVKVLKDYQHLERFCIGSNMITSKSCKEIYLAFKDHKNISVLDLGRYKSTIDMGEIPNIIRDEGTIWIVQLLRENKSLKYLSLINNHITDISIDLLYQVVYESSLLFLHTQEYFRSSSKLDSIMKKKREHLNVKDSELRFIKHGSSIENIDSIYRNNM